MGFNRMIDEVSTKRRLKIKISNCFFCDWIVAFQSETRIEMSLVSWKDKIGRSSEIDWPFLGGDNGSIPTQKLFHKYNTNTIMPTQKITKRLHKYNWNNTKNTLQDQSKYYKNAKQVQYNCHTMSMKFILHLCLWKTPIV